MQARLDEGAGTLEPIRRDIEQERLTPRNIAPRLPDSYGKPRSTSGARATQRLRPRVASATSTITAAVRPTSTRGCAEATTPGVGDCHTRFWKANRMRTMYVPGSELTYTAIT
jgi:hypothetical protein